MKPAEILDFWFGAPGSAEHGTSREAWFKKDPAFDREIHTRFGAAVDKAIDGGFSDWATSAEGTLALLILLDQFPRNLFRGNARSFAGDARARDIANNAIAKGFDQERPPIERTFFYLPFEHSESIADQDRSVALFKALGGKEVLDYALKHRDIIARFGRFPHRNAALGRASTPEEQAFLKEPGSSF